MFSYMSENVVHTQRESIYVAFFWLTVDVRTSLFALFVLRTNRTEKGYFDNEKFHFSTVLFL